MKSYYNGLWADMRSKLLSQCSPSTPNTSYPTEMHSQLIFPSSFLPPETAPAPVDVRELSFATLTKEYKEGKVKIVPSLHSDPHTLEMSKETDFGELFDQLGEHNVQNISGLEDQFIAFDVFRFLVERQATLDWPSKRGTTLKPLCSVSMDGRLFTDVGVVNGKVCGRVGTQQVETWAEAVQLTYSVDVFTATTIVGHFCGMSPLNLLHFSENSRVCETRAKHRVERAFPEFLKLPQGGILPLYKSVEMIGHAGQCIGIYLWYRNESCSFCLCAPVIKGIARLGHGKPVPHFHNESRFENHPGATILLFQDMRTAISLEERLHELRGYNPSEVVVSGHLGTDLKKLPWQVFWGRNIVIVPAPSAYCLSQIKSYEQYAIGCGARSFRVHPGFVLHSLPSGEPIESIANLSVDYIDRIGEVLPLARRIIHDAVDVTELVKLGKESGLFKIPQQEKVENLTPSDQFLHKIPKERLPSKAYDIDAVTLDHVFRRGANASIIGLKGAGKTTLIMAILRDLFEGSTILGVMKNEHHADNNVLLIDPETPKDEIDETIADYGLGNRVGRQLHVIAAKDEANPDWCEPFDLREVQFRRGIFDYALQHKCRYLLLDGLIPLMGNTIPDQRSAKILADWIMQCENVGMCVTCLHHAKNDNGDPNGRKGRGNQCLTIHARTEVILVSKEDIANGTPCLPEVKEKAETDDGLTLGIYFKSCKTAPILAGKTFWYHVPMGTTLWSLICATNQNLELMELSRNVEDVSDKTERPSMEPADEVGAQTEATPLPDDPRLSLLSDDARKVYAVLVKRKSLQTGDVKGITGFGDTKAREILSELVKARLAQQQGKGRGTRYVPADATPEKTV